MQTLTSGAVVTGGGVTLPSSIAWPSTSCQRSHASSVASATAAGRNDRAPSSSVSSRRFASAAGQGSKQFLDRASSGRCSGMPYTAGTSVGAPAAMRESTRHGTPHMDRPTTVTHGRVFRYATASLHVKSAMTREGPFHRSMRRAT